ncbi:MAG TPA: hypothetical protein VKA63_03710 [Candidatus Krumholzibacteria bacterium]|nr:hypothetical protein [Candidatus Krumholzibacteria bacterium]
MKNLIWLALSLALAVGITACQSGITGEVTANQPPDTRVTATPPALEETSFTVQFYWTGLDNDGWVDHFEWRISDNGQDGIVDQADTLGLPWHSTVVTDSTFSVSADIALFQTDVDNPQITDPKDFRYWQTHTFFVRAVDNLGVPDETPAMVSFTATTLSPTITITLPKSKGTIDCVSSARALTFGWEGDDPDNVASDPAAVRYALVNTRDVMEPALGPDTCLTRFIYQTIDPAKIFNGHWSNWIAYDAPEDSGRVVTFPVKDVGESFFFAVQAKDVAGAVTPTLEWNTNVRHVRISPGKAPTLSVTEKFLGNSAFNGPNLLKTYEIAAGQPLNFSWTADASDYAGIIDAYRFGWEIQDVNDQDDPGWAVPWGSGTSYLRASTRTFQQGSPNFVVQCRDNSGAITRGTFQFEVVQITPRSQQLDLLFVTDYDLPQDQEPAITWRSQWESMLAGKVSSFDPSVDYVRGQDVDFRLINRYKSVIWFVQGKSANTGFATKLRPTTAGPRYNWLEVYQSKIGNVLFVGPYASLGMIENLAVEFPVVYNTEARLPLGLGCSAFSGEGACTPAGTERWPYTGWCLDASDWVRPVSDGRTGEGGGAELTSTLRCDYLFRAEVDPDFLEQYPSAQGVVQDLVTKADSPRLPQSNNYPKDLAFYRYQWEEFYNRNIAPKREVTLIPRDCQMAMYLHRAARDEVWPAGTALAGDPIIPNAKTSCQPYGREDSPIDGAAVAIVSNVYSPYKQLPGSQDFLWGFNPLAFDLDNVESALLWIIGQNWNINVTN